MIVYCVGSRRDARSNLSFPTMNFEEEKDCITSRDTSLHFNLPTHDAESGICYRKTKQTAPMGHIIQVDCSAIQ